MATKAKAGNGRGKKARNKRPISAVIAPKVDAPRVATEHGHLDLDDPELPEWVENRAGAEQAPCLSTPNRHKTFLRQAPSFEKMLLEAGIVVFKFRLETGRAMLLKRFRGRRRTPLKLWKLSPADYAAMEKWGAYTKAREQMFAAHHTEAAPGIVVRPNDKERAGLAIIREVPGTLDYAGKDTATVRRPDPQIPAYRPDLSGWTLSIGA